MRNIRGIQEELYTVDTVLTTHRTARQLDTRQRLRNFLWWFEAPAKTKKDIILQLLELRVNDGANTGEMYILLNI